MAAKYFMSTALNSGDVYETDISDNWHDVTVSYTGSDPADTALSVSVLGSADEGATWFPLSNDRAPWLQNGTGVVFFNGQTVNAVKATGYCTPPNTLTISITGNL